MVDPQDLRELQTACFSFHEVRPGRIKDRIVHLDMLYLPMVVQDLENDEKTNNNQKLKSSKIVLLSLSRL